MSRLTLKRTRKRRKRVNEDDDDESRDADYQIPSSPQTDEEDDDDDADEKEEQQSNRRTRRKGPSGQSLTATKKLEAEQRKQAKQQTLANRPQMLARLQEEWFSWQHKYPTEAERKKNKAELVRIVATTTNYCYTKTHKTDKVTQETSRWTRALIAVGLTCNWIQDPAVNRASSSSTRLVSQSSGLVSQSSSAALGAALVSQSSNSDSKKSCPRVLRADLKSLVFATQCALEHEELLAQGIDPATQQPKTEVGVQKTLTALIPNFLSKIIYPEGTIGVPIKDDDKQFYSWIEPITPIKSSHPLSRRSATSSATTKQRSRKASSVSSTPQALPPLVALSSPPTTTVPKRAATSSRISGNIDLPLQRGGIKGVGRDLLSATTAAAHAANVANNAASVANNAASVANNATSVANHATSSGITDLATVKAEPESSQGVTATFHAEDLHTIRTVRVNDREVIVFSVPLPSIDWAVHIYKGGCPIRIACSENDQVTATGSYATHLSGESRTPFTYTMHVPKLYEHYSSVPTPLFVPGTGKLEVWLCSERDLRDALTCSMNDWFQFITSQPEAQNFQILPKADLVAPPFTDTSYVFRTLKLVSTTASQSTHAPFSQSSQSTHGTMPFKSPSLSGCDPLLVPTALPTVHFAYPKPDYHGYESIHHHPIHHHPMVKAESIDSYNPNPANHDGEHLVPLPSLELTTASPHETLSETAALAGVSANVANVANAVNAANAAKSEKAVKFEPIS